MAKHAAVSTQELNPRSTSNRTLFQALITLFPLANAALLVIQGVLLEADQGTIPGWVWAVINGAVLVCGIVMKIASRIMAIPGVNEWLRKYAPWLAPEDDPAALPPQ